MQSAIAIPIPDDGTRSRCLAVIASTMRSGSTLLKALLQEAPDVSKLSEINFQRYAGRPERLAEMWELDPRPILLLKRPAWYHEAGRYPLLPPVPGLRVIALVRDCYDTVQSLRRMSLGPAAAWSGWIVDQWLALRYWRKVTERLLTLAGEQPERIRLVRYEDLVADPVGITAGLFRFLGSSQSSGVDRYSPPQNFRWRWGTDDNSPQIRSLRVQPRRTGPPPENRLSRWIAEHPELHPLRQQLGYGS